jgi:hypothetical protein
MTTTQERINDLYARRQALLNDTDSELATFHNERRMAILREMKEELDRLECIKRQENATQTKLRIEQAQRQQRQRST